MSNQTRKRIWPVSLAAAIGIVAMLAMLSATMWGVGSAQAQVTPPPPATEPTNLQATAVSATEINLMWGRALGAASYEIQRKTGSGAYSTIAATNVPRSYSDTGLTASTMYTYRVRGVNAGGSGMWSDEAMATTMASGTTGTVTPAAEDMITSDSTSGGAAPELKVVIDSLPADGLAVGSSIVLYLEDDYQEPAMIPASSVYFVAEPARAPTGNGARVYTTIAPKIDTGAYFDEDKKDISIRVFIPDMCTSSTTACQGPNGVDFDQKLTMVIEDDSGIKNPTEEGTHSVFLNILGPAESMQKAATTLALNDALRATDKLCADDPACVDEKVEQTLPTWAKISLSDVDNKRGYELTITGSGFNDGTTASAYVLRAASAPADCAAIVANPASTLIGSGLVGSDDKVTIVVDVTVPTFGAGNVNQICMVDGENRYSSDIDDFKLESSIRIVPNMVSSGDTVNVFAQDYPADGGVGFVELKLAGQVVNSATATVNAVSVRSTSLTDGAATATFKVPGSVGGKPLQGTVRVDATWGDDHRETPRSRWPALS